MEWRRDLHMHPELGFQEERTSGLVARELATLGYRVQRSVGRTGVVGDLGSGSYRIGIRADMDALPIAEENAVEFASLVDGVMHACGHDAHTAIGLGVATLLAEENLPGAVRFLFQPAEEIADDEGYSGAPRMIQDGALADVDVVLALHVHGGTPVGSIQLGEGPISAGVDSFHLRVNGQGAHGAYPHRGRDPIHIAAHVIQAVQGIVSRWIDPFDPAVVTIGSIRAGHADNVIPEEVVMSGTIRYLRPEVRDQIHAELERAAAVARTLGGDYSLTVHGGSSAVSNDPRLVSLVRDVAVDLLGADSVLPRQHGLGAEDFAAFAARVPGVMFRLGCRIEGDERKAHTPTFDIDERCLPIGVALLTEVALRELRASAAEAKR